MPNFVTGSLDCDARVTQNLPMLYKLTWLTVLSG